MEFVVYSEFFQDLQGHVLMFCDLSQKLLPTQVAGSRLKSEGLAAAPQYRNARQNHSMWLQHLPNDQVRDQANAFSYSSVLLNVQSSGHFAERCRWLAFPGPDLLWCYVRIPITKEYGTRKAQTHFGWFISRSVSEALNRRLLHCGTVWESETHSSRAFFM